MTDKPSKNDELINLNQDLKNLFNNVSSESLGALLFCFSVLVDESEMLSERYIAKAKILEFIKHYLPNENL